jgi:iron complex outermembrane receptor protein
LGAAYDQGSTPRSGGLPSLGTLHDWGARVGLSALVNDGRTMLHAGASRRGRFPALREAYAEALNRFVPNPDLRPEHLVAVEAGITSRVGAGEVQLVGFHHDLSGAIRRITFADGTRQRVNADELRSVGVEALFSQTWQSVEVGGDLTLQSVELTDPGSATSSRPENVPERSGRAHVRVPLGAGVSATVEAEYTGEQFCQDPDSGADVRLGGGSRINGLLSRVWTVAGALPGRLETSVAVDNLTDRALYDQCGLPRPGRLVRFQVRVF